MTQLYPKQLIIFSLSWLSILSGFAQKINPEKVAFPEKIAFHLKEKSFHFFYLLSTDKGLQALTKHPYFNCLLVQKSALLHGIDSSDTTNIRAIYQKLQWQQQEIDSVSNVFAYLYHHNKELKNLVREKMRPSYNYALYQELNDDSLLVNAWQDGSKAVNHVINAYVFKTGLRYPDADSAFYDVSSGLYAAKLTQLLLTLKQKKYTSFIQLYLDVTTQLLLLNKRDEAARFEPLVEHNMRAYNRIAQIDWSDYPYSAVIVPGAAARDYTTALAPIAKQRCDLAVKRYREKKAPFIIVTGGYVHPAFTPFCEAIEMKKYLIAEAGLPESVIIIEPHARHTTTNLRNSSRIIIRSGMPTAKPALITSTSSQIKYILERMPETSKTVLGYLPYKAIKKLSEEDIELTINPQSLFIDASDPLDP